MYTDLVLFQKTYDFMLYMYPMVNKFPKSQRFVLAQHIENITLEILEKIIEINSCDIKEKRDLVRKIDINVDKLKILFRLAKELKFINIKRYGIISEKIIELGKLTKGWQKSLI
ncbi:MAG: diversity-generating retroelement protein Avd [Candidatus Paceibacterota bacterium]|jgi:hypothetical protein